MREKKWNFLEKTADAGVVYALSHVFGISPLLSTVLVNRGLSDAAEAKLFLDHSLMEIHSPFLLKGMDRAVARIRRAKECGEKVTVYGDYDVDGVTATTLLVMYLRHMGIRVSYYIPERQEEGYGIHRSAIEQIAADGATLIVSVDTGITAVDEVEFAKSIGVDMIITDHHSCKEVVPNAVAVVNPKQPDCRYPFKELAGVGVAFKLVHALSGEPTAENLLRELGDLLALGTIADVVSLTGENRVFVYCGIDKMKRRPLVGIEKIMGVARVSDKEITSQTVSFMIAPRVNAAGRMGRAVDAVDLLLTEDPLLAASMARDLDVLNRERQSREGEIMQEAVEMLESGEYDDDGMLVLAHENWHHGIIGIVASRIAERFGKPTILISLEGDMGKGSGRSVGSLNLFTALSFASPALLKFGGHALAAGLTVKRSELGKLRKLLNQYAAEHKEAIPEIPNVDIDYAVSGRMATLDTVRELQCLEPYGMGNRQPMLALLRAKVTGVKTMSEGKHLKLGILHDRTALEAVGFGMGELADELSEGDEIDLAGAMESNTFNGITKVQMRISEVRFTPEEEHRDYILYEELQIAYRTLRGFSGGSPVSVPKAHPETVLFGEKTEMSAGKAAHILEIFRDCGLICFEDAGDQWTVTVNPFGSKVDILQADRYLEVKRMAMYEQ